MRKDHLAEIEPADRQNNVAEVLKVDLAGVFWVSDGDHGQQLVVRYLLAHSTHGGFDLLGINRATTVLVEGVEGCQRVQQPGDKIVKEDCRSCLGLGYHPLERINLLEVK